MNNFNHQEAQEEDIPHPKDKNRSYLKDLENQVAAYFKKRHEVQKDLVMYNPAEVEAIRKNL